MADIKVTSRCSGCPGHVDWLLSERVRGGAPELRPQGDCLTLDDGREVLCPACTTAVRAFLEQRLAAARIKPAPAKKVPPVAANGKA